MSTILLNNYTSIIGNRGLEINSLTLENVWQPHTAQIHWDSAAGTYCFRTSSSVFGVDLGKREEC